MWRGRGCHAKASELFAEALTAIAASEGFPMTAPNVPSFTYTVSGRTVAALHALLAESYLLQDRHEAAMTCAKRGLAAAANSSDVYSARELQQLLVRAQLHLGLVGDAFARLGELIDTARHVAWRGIEGVLGQALVDAAHFGLELRVTPALTSSADVVDKLFHRAKSTHADPTAPLGVGAVQDAVGLLHVWCANHGLNLPVDTAKWGACIERHNPTLRVLVPALVLAGRCMLFAGRTDEAADAFRQAIAMEPHSFDTERYPTAMVDARVLLASALRQSGGACDDAKLIHKLPVADRTAAARQLFERGAAAADGDAIAVEPVAVDDERVALLTAAIQKNVCEGTHDLESLRMALLELVMVYVAQGSVACHEVAVALLQTACRVSAMQQALFHNTTAFADGAIVEELPVALSDDLDDVARRAQSSQAAFAAADKGAAAAKARPTLQHLLAHYAALHVGLRAQSPTLTRPVEAKLIRLRAYLQQHPTDGAQAVFEKAPALDQRCAALPPHAVLSQAYAATTTAARTRVVSGVEVVSPPALRLLVAVWPNDDGSGARDADPAAAPAKAAAKAKKADPKGDAAAAPPAPPGSAAPVAALQLAAIDVDQEALRAVHTAAVELHRRMTAGADVAKLDDVVADSGIVAPAGKEGGKKGAAPPPAKKEALVGATPVPAEACDADSTAALDDAKGGLLLSFLDMLVAARRPNGHTAADVQPLHPPFALAAAHVKFIANFTQPSGGALAEGSEEISGWMIRIVVALNRLASTSS
jgi:tetratricopeptide (TPR) repeat protein